MFAASIYFLMCAMDAATYHPDVPVEIGVVKRVG